MKKWEEKKMINIKEDEKLSVMNHSCAHLLAQAVKHLYPKALFWVGPVIEEGFYYDIDLGDESINDELLDFSEKHPTHISKKDAMELVDTLFREIDQYLENLDEESLC